MNHLDLFSGIGGFRIAIDLCRIPVEHSYHSDIEDYANAVYAKNYPDSVPLGDVRRIDGRELRAKHPSPWLCSLGFPCTDISDAGKRKGLKGERSGLWYEAIRVIQELRPEIVFIENVAALRNRGLIDVLRGLDQAGYMGEWRTLSALEVGGLHLRKRLWITACSRDADRHELRTHRLQSQGKGDVGDGAEPDGPTHALLSRLEWETAKTEGAFLGQPLVRGKADGLSERDYRAWRARNKALGNAIVPQCAAKVLGEWLDKA